MAGVQSHRDHGSTIIVTTQTCDRSSAACDDDRARHHLLGASRVLVTAGRLLQYAGTPTVTHTQCARPARPARC
eukprot:1420792-Prymnesium_polylepis.1